MTKEPDPLTQGRITIDESTLVRLLGDTRAPSWIQRMQSDWRKQYQNLRRFISWELTHWIKSPTATTVSDLYQRLLFEVLRLLRTCPQLKRCVLPSIETIKSGKKSIETLDCWHSGTRSLSAKHCHFQEELIFELAADNEVIFNEPHLTLYPRMSDPAVLSNGKFFCLPRDESGEWSTYPYFCHKTIGVEDTNPKQDDGTIYLLEEGRDTMFAFFNSKNIFLLKKGTKIIHAGRKDDIFVVYPYAIEGHLYGGDGFNTLVLVCPEKMDDDIEVILYLGEQGKLLAKKKEQETALQNLHLSLIQHVIGRKNKKEQIYVGCDTRLVDSGGGTRDYPDDIVISPDPSCFFTVFFVLSPYTAINNTATVGNFSYVVPRETLASESLHFYFTAQKTNSKHYFFFDESFVRLTCIDFLSPYLHLHFGAASSVTIQHPPERAWYYFTDQANLQINIKEGRRIVTLFQQVDKSVPKILVSYPLLADHLKMNVVLYSPREQFTVVISRGMTVVQHGQYTSHLIGEKGQNHYIIRTVADPTSWAQLPLKTITLYHIKKKQRGNENSTEIDRDTLDLREVRSQIWRHLHQEASIHIRTDLENPEDIGLYLSTIKEEIAQTVLEIHLHQGIYWYPQLDIQWHQRPLRLVHIDFQWHLQPVPRVSPKKELHGERQKREPRLPPHWYPAIEPSEPTLNEKRALDDVKVQAMSQAQKTPAFSGPWWKAMPYGAIASLPFVLLGVASLASRFCMHRRNILAMGGAALTSRLPQAEAANDALEPLYQRPTHEPYKDVTFPSTDNPDPGFTLLLGFTLGAKLGTLFGRRRHLKLESRLWICDEEPFHDPVDRAERLLNNAIARYGQ